MFPEPKLRYHVYATAFHRGGLISRHRTSEAAERAARRWRMTDCVCGCAAVIDIVADGKPPAYRNSDESPYQVCA